MSNSTADATESKELYPYKPSFALALIFGAAFSLVFLYHLFQYIRNKAWFLYFILLGIAMELVGFWARAYSTKNLENFASYSVSYLLIMLAPSVLAAGLYQTFGRLLYYTVPPSHRTFRTLLLPARFIAPFFVIFDVLAFFIQLIGLGIVIQNIKKKDNTEARDRGINILRAGLILQTLVFGAFAVLSMRIILISKRWRFAWPDSGKWRRLGWVVAAGSYLITFRALFRILEFSINDSDNYLSKTEWPAYVFDAVPMLLLCISYNFYHPSKYLPESHMSLSHAYKRLGNPNPDPKLRDVELSRREPGDGDLPVAVAGGNWAGLPQRTRPPPPLYFSLRKLIPLLEDEFTDVFA
ncbi:MAG: hypothetical protein Q9184_000272 [Pyrenodesmia sp. 2 TL-2023]